LNKKIFVQDLGLIDYKEGWEYQERLFNQITTIKVANRTAVEPVETPNFLLFCEHPHVYTLGKSGSLDHLLINEDGLEKANATFYKINRGGDITYHGPGQLVGYPILDLDNFFTDIHKYLRLLEEAVIRTLAFYGVIAGRSIGQTGVWLPETKTQKERKICAMGVRASRWVTMHGFAFNINNDLSYFSNIIPCGITDKPVTSLEAELGKKVALAEVKKLMQQHLAEVFEATWIEGELNNLIQPA